MIFAADDLVLDTPRPTALFSAAASFCEANIWTSVNGWSVARLFSSLNEEYAAAHAGAVITDLGAMARYAVRGDDAATMLSRITTAPAARLQPGESARGLILTQAGAVIDLAEVARLSDELLLLTTPLAHERRMRLAAKGLDVAFDDVTSQVASLGIFGPLARDVAAKAGVNLGEESAAASGHIRGVETAARSSQFGSLPGVEMVFPREEALTVWERLMRVKNVRPIGLDTLEILRLEGGAPRPGADFISAQSKRSAQSRFPEELGLAHLAPVDRGWFNGRRGLRKAPQPTRQLVSLSLDTETPMAGAAVFSDGKPVGRLTTCAYSPRSRRVIAFADIAMGVKTDALEVAAAPPADHNVAAKRIKTTESNLATDFRVEQKKSTEKRRWPV